MKMNTKAPWIFFLHISECLRSMKQMTVYVGKVVEEGEHSSITCGTANLYSNYGSQCGDFQEKGTWSSSRAYCTTVEHVFKGCLLYHCWACIQMMPAVPLMGIYSTNAYCTTFERVFKGCLLYHWWTCSQRMFHSTTETHIQPGY